MNEPQHLRPQVGALAVAMLALVLYALSLQNGFAYDDVPIIQGDARVRSLENIGAIFTGGYWADADLALYRPLTTLSFALDWSLAPDSPAWFHFTNVLLHALASAFAFLLLARFFPATAALVGGLVFAAHPVHVEAVANVVGRAELLSAVFALAAALAWVGPSDPAFAERPRAASRVALVAALLLAALLSKEGAIMLPALLLLLDMASGRLVLRRAGEWLRRDLRAFAVLLVVAVACLALRHAAIGALAPERLDPALEVAATQAERWLTAFQAWPWYLRLLLFPSTLLADYGPRIIMPASAWTPAAITGLLLLASATVGGVLALVRGYRRAALALFWFLLAILPVSNLVVPIGIVVAERTLYLPSLALAMGVSGLAAAVLRVQPTAGALTVATAAVLLLMAVRVVTRIPDWRSTDTIMVAQVRDRPDSFRGHWHIARMHRAANHTARALAEYGTAIELWPHRRGLVVEAAAWAAGQGALRQAAEWLAWAASKWPDDLDVQRMRAGVALDLGDHATARAAVSLGLRMQPQDPLLRRMAAALDSLTGTHERP